MKIQRWKTWLVMMTTAGALFQVPTCNETANAVTAVATTVTAGAAVYLVSEILD